MKFNKSIFLLPGFLALINSCGNSINAEKERALLLETDREFARTSVMIGAAEAFQAFLDSDALQLPAGGHPVRCRDNIYFQMKAENSSAVLNWEPQEAEVARSGDLGYTWGTYIVSWVDADGQLQSPYGKYLNIWKKQSDGKWKVLIDMGNASPPPHEE